MMLSRWDRKIVCVGHSFALACEQDRLCNTRQEIFSQTSMIPFLISDMLKDVPWDYFVFLDLQIALFWATWMHFAVRRHPWRAGNSILQAETWRTLCPMVHSLLDTLCSTRCQWFRVSVPVSWCLCLVGIWWYTWLMRINEIEFFCRGQSVQSKTVFWNQ